MKEQIKIIQLEIDDLFNLIRLKRHQIDEIYSSCQHIWTEPKLAIQNIGFDCGSYGGSYTSRKWERECTKCGKIDWTMREAMQPVPIFGEDANVGKIVISHPHG